MGWDTILTFLGKESAKQLFKAYLVPLFFKDKKFYPKRILVIILVIIVGYLIYRIPELLPNLAFAFGYYSSLEEIKPSEFMGRMQDEHYLAVIKYLFVLAYLTFLLVIQFFIIAHKQNKIHYNTEERNVALFAQDVGLIEGVRCANKEERSLVVNKISEKIKTSNTCRFMLINGYHDLTDPESEIKIALESRKKDINLKLLLLDPFSEYARKRADKLLPETDEYLSKMRYVKDFFKVVEKIESLKLQSNNIDYKVYCSNPFFRIYLFDEEFIFQAYQNDKHGHQTPMYHYVSTSRSLYHLGREMFNYHWNRGYKFDESSIKYYESPLIYYLAKMYGVLKEPSNDVDKILKDILSYVDDQKKKVAQLEKEGLLTETDD